MLKGTIHQQDIRILNIYKSNIGTSKCKKQKLIELRREIGNSKIIVRPCNNLLSVIKAAERKSEGT